MDKINPNLLISLGACGSEAKRLATGCSVNSFESCADGLIADDDELGLAANGAGRAGRLEWAVSGSKSAA